MAFVPEGQADRSLARSAWDNATPKSRPVGYGVIRAGVRANSMIGVTKFPIRRLKTFTLSVGLAAPDQTVPYGTVLWRDTFPGTSCLATIRLSLRDKIRSTDRRYLILLVRRSSGVAECAEFRLFDFANLHSAQAVSREFAGARLPPPATPELL